MWIFWNYYFKVLFKLVLILKKNIFNISHGFYIYFGNISKMLNFIEKMGHLSNLYTENPYIFLKTQRLAVQYHI